MSKWPAVDVAHTGDADLALAIVDDFSPTAVEPRDGGFRIFFPATEARDAACVRLSAAGYRATSIGVDDEDWARRSQENLTPVPVGRIVVTPRRIRLQADEIRLQPDPTREPDPTHPMYSTGSPLVIVIQPSMGFGTGHHATTRLCLRALQTVDLESRFILDVGTGSGVLAIAAVRLGAARAVGIDHDADAIQAALENLTLNNGVEAVEFQIADLSAAHLPAADVVTANLTGAMLIRSAARLLDLVRPEGTLIVSGLLEEERDDVLRAFGDAGSKRSRPTSSPTAVGRGLSDLPLVWEQREDGWLALAMKRS